MVTTEEWESFFQRWMKAISRGDWDALREMMTPDIQVHEPSEVVALGREQYLDYIKRWSAAFTEWESTSAQTFIQGDWLVSRGIEISRHTGEWLGIPATGKKVTYDQAGFARLEGGKLAEAWIYCDVLSWHRQIGAAPPALKPG